MAAFPGIFVVTIKSASYGLAKLVGGELGVAGAISAPRKGK